MTEVIGRIMMEFYVSTDGDDRNPGTDALPFKTVERARDAVRSLTGRMNGDIVIYLRGGTYSIERTIRFDHRDSGGGGNFVVYRNYPGETPVISGGRKVSHWSRADGMGIDNLWKAEVPDIQNTRQLYINGRKAERPRSEIRETVGWGVVEDPDMQFYNLIENFSCMQGDFSVYEGFKTTRKEMTGWRNHKDIEMVFDVAWTHSVCPVDEIVPLEDGALIRMRMPCFRDCQIKSGVRIGSPSYIENAFELLDEPGEWYLDRTEHVLYYIPRPDEDMTSAEAVVPVVERLMEITGTLDQPVSGIRFEGLTFSNSTWLRPGVEGHPELQANLVKDPKEDLLCHSYFMKITSAIIVNATENLAFERCRFTRLGSGALDIQRGSNRIRVVGCRFDDLSASGIQIGGFNHLDAHPEDKRDVVRDILISNNLFHDIGTDYKGSIAVLVGFAQDVVISHNEIFHIAYSGISVGWGWGYWDVGTEDRTYLKAPEYYPKYSEPTIACRNRIEYNHIHHVMRKLTDGGAIYTLSMQEGSKIIGNLLHDNGGFCGKSYEKGVMVHSDLEGVNPEITDLYHIKGFPGGIYEDDSSGGFEVAENIVYNVVVPFFYHEVGVQGRWESNHVHDNFFGVTPGDADFQHEMADRAGLEPEYRDLLNV